MILYKLTFTRQNINDPYWIEKNPPSHIWATHPLKPLEQVSPLQTAILHYTYSEFITWEELYARKDDLPTIIQASLDYFSLKELLADPTTYNRGPEWNPLSLTKTCLTIFTNLADAKQCLNIVFNEINLLDMKESMDFLNIKITNEETYEDDVLIGNLINLK
jgi:hypothetical protein